MYNLCVHVYILFSLERKSQIILGSILVTFYNEGDVYKK